MCSEGHWGSARGVRVILKIQSVSEGVLFEGELVVF